MKKIVKLFAIAAVTLGVYSCEEYNAGEENSNLPSSVSFTRSQFTHEIEEADPVYALEVYATTTSDQDRVVEIEIDPAATTALAGDFELETTSVVIPAGSLKGSTDLTFDLDNIPMGVSRMVTFDIVPSENVVLNNTTSTIELSYTPKCPFNKVEFSLILDRWGSETSWEIYQGADVVASGGPYTDGATNAVQPEKKFTFCLEDGDYTLVVYDAYGDGMVTSATVHGSYTIKHNGNILVSGDGNFGDSISHNFTL